MKPTATVLDRNLENDVVLTDQDPPLVAGLKIFARWYRSRLGRVVVLGSLTLFAAFSIVVASFSYNGWCHGNGRFLSDQDAIDAVIREIVQQPTGLLVDFSSDNRSLIADRVERFESVDQFKQLNPDCCRIIPHNQGDSGPYTTLTQRLGGYAAKVVMVSYQLDYFDDSGLRRRAAQTAHAAVTNCGRPWRAQH